MTVHPSMFETEWHAILTFFLFPWLSALKKNELKHWIQYHDSYDCETLCTEHMWNWAFPLLKNGLTLHTVYKTEPFRHIMHLILAVVPAVYSISTCKLLKNCLTYLLCIKLNHSHMYIKHLILAVVPAVYNISTCKPWPFSFVRPHTVDRGFCVPLDVVGGQRVWSGGCGHWQLCHGWEATLYVDRAWVSQVHTPQPWRLLDSSGDAKKDKVCW